MSRWDQPRLDGLAQIVKGKLLPTSGSRLESSVRYLGAADLEGQDSGHYAPSRNAVLCNKDDILRCCGTGSDQAWWGAVLLVLLVRRLLALGHSARKLRAGTSTTT